jgi:probable aminopeptidase NPEPL1
MSELRFNVDVTKSATSAECVVLMAPRKTWDGGWPSGAALPKPLAQAARASAAGLESGPNGASAETRLDGRRIVSVVLPDSGSRHNSPARNEAVLASLRSVKARGHVLILTALDAPAHDEAVAVAIGRAFPSFSRKTGSSKPLVVDIAATDPKGRTLAFDTRTQSIVRGSRWAAELVDTPTSELHTDTFVARARALVKGLKGVKITEIVGDALLKKGLGGIHAVGRAAITAPRLLILEYKPKKARRTVALVGKGIVFDTGGLSLKPTANMCSMKGDMGGAAAVVGAFDALVRSGCKDHLFALAPLAENAIGSKSYRNDDILTMHSGHTVEINNTDAEGRLLLGDGVSYAARQLRADVIVDVATLTGAQLVATGLRHAAVVSNRASLEAHAVTCGRDTGDLVHPLPFAPEFYQSEFASVVADMRNSVKDRSNAQSSCAAQFVWAHIDDVNPHWLHIDIAGPAWRNERGTGFGVGLLAAIVEELKPSDLAD